VHRLYCLQPAASLAVATAAYPCGVLGAKVQGDFDLSLPADGLLAAALMTGLMLSAPTAAQLSRHYPSLKLISAGLRCVWHPFAPTLFTPRISAAAAAGGGAAAAAAGRGCGSSLK
jgi:hypothetical protein